MVLALGGLALGSEAWGLLVESANWDGSLQLLGSFELTQAAEAHRAAVRIAWTGEGFGPHDSGTTELVRAIGCEAG